MSYQNPRIEILKEMMRLEEKRAGLQTELESLVQRLSDLRDHLFEGGSSTAGRNGKAEPAVRAKASKRGSGARRERGALKEQILAALDAAGSNGVRVVDLAKAIGARSANIHAWFQSAKKRFPQIKRIGTGLYRLEGKIEQPDRPAPLPKAPRGKAGRKNSTPGGLSTRIVAALQAAGEGGQSISNLSEALSVPYRNISVWFSTTGKKNAQIKKVSPAVYRLEAQ